MLHAAIDSGVQLVGFGDFGELGGSAAIQNLQQAMVSLSQTGWPAANPGPVTGEVTPQMIAALGAVVANLAELSSSQKAALQVLLLSASVSTTAMAAAKTAIASQALTLQLAVMGLVAKRTASAKPPAPPPPVAPVPPALFMTLQKMSPSPSLVTGSLPPGSLQARTAIGTYRVAVPKSFASGLGNSGLGADLVELAPRPAPSAGAITVSETELNKELKPPFYKRPLYWVAIAGGAALIGGAVWMIRR